MDCAAYRSFAFVSSPPDASIILFVHRRTK
jgi:hypothetical protein